MIRYPLNHDRKNVGSVPSDPLSDSAQNDTNMNETAKAVLSTFVEEGLYQAQKVKGGYKWGSKGKVYKSKSKAARQGRAIKASQARRRKK